VVSNLRQNFIQTGDPSKFFIAAVVGVATQLYGLGPRAVPVQNKLQKLRVFHAGRFGWGSAIRNAPSCR
jgi:hypothetical protein